MIKNLPPILINFWIVFNKVLIFLLLFMIFIFSHDFICLYKIFLKVGKSWHQICFCNLSFRRSFSCKHCTIYHFVTLISQWLFVVWQRFYLFFQNTRGMKAESLGLRNVGLSCYRNCILQVRTIKFQLILLNWICSFL